jgi:hypothetical protein
LGWTGGAKRKWYLNALFTTTPIVQKWNNKRKKNVEKQIVPHELSAPHFASWSKVLEKF